MADIRGTISDPIKPSEASLAYRPVYLFYCNEDMVLDGDGAKCNGEASQGDSGVITLADYTFDDDEEEELENAACKLCGIAESKDNVNTIFFCDNCSEGVHQLCENPPIAQYEMEVDPWYCRDCSARMGIPIPPPIQASHGIKRRREEEGSL